MGLNTQRWFPGVDEKGRICQTVSGRFVDVEVVDAAASHAAGEEVTKMVPALESKVNGSHDVSVQAVKPFNKRDLVNRFPGAWEHYEDLKAKNESREDEELSIIRNVSGTPLSDGGFIPRAKIEFLWNSGIQTLEQLAAVSDTTASQLGHGALTWRKKAADALRNKQMPSYQSATA